MSIEYRCPACGSEELFAEVRVQAYVLQYKGSRSPKLEPTPTRYVHWPTTHMYCAECPTEGTAERFTIKKTGA